jgi:ADP-ribose pyrophosphatase YjhB (NUDIX family)
MVRHFTATGFIVHEKRTLLLWHKRLQMWVPPGGHIEADEDPASAVLREIREETGLAAEVVPLARAFDFPYPGQIQPPYTILLEDSAEPGEPHQHIDFIYFCRLADGATPEHRGDAGARWVGGDALAANEPLPLAADVRALALVAIEVVDRRGRESRP